MDTMDPFRTSQSVGTCPRCKQTLEADGGMRLVCLGGCGEWHPKEALDRRLDWHLIEHRPAVLRAGHAVFHNATASHPRAATYRWSS